MGCVLSIDPKIDELLTAMNKDTAATKSISTQSKKDDICLDDFEDEEGYSDDEMFSVNELQPEKMPDQENDIYNFKSWILDICFINVGWLFKRKERIVSYFIIIMSLFCLSKVCFK